MNGEQGRRYGRLSSIRSRMAGQWAVGQWSCFCNMTVVPVGQLKMWSIESKVEDKMLNATWNSKRMLAKNIKTGNGNKKA